MVDWFSMPSAPIKKPRDKVCNAIVRIVRFNDLRNTIITFRNMRFKQVTTPFFKTWLHDCAKILNGANQGYL